jgi:hypothetical protein
MFAINKKATDPNPLPYGLYLEVTTHNILSVVDPAFQVNPDRDPIQINGFHDQKLKEKNTTEIF